MTTSILFAVIGHNEAATLTRTCELAAAAALPGDQVVFIDSASTDESLEVATAAGFTAWSAPLGKGAAMAEAVRRAQSLTDRPHWIVFLDADISDSEHNIPEILARAARSRPEHLMVIGAYDVPQEVVQGVAHGVVRPMLSSFYPHAFEAIGPMPLSGQRAVALDLLDPERFPPDFGIESYLDCELLDLAVRTGRRDALSHVDIGWLEHPFKYKPRAPIEIGQALLDTVQAQGRLTPVDRTAWEGWLSDVATVIASYRGNIEDRPRFARELAAASVPPAPGTTDAVAEAA